MIDTGRINPITKEKIMRYQEHDIEWKEGQKFSDLIDEEKVKFLSFIQVPFLNDEIEPKVSELYDYYTIKNT